jgi:malate permease and related proteins
MEIFLITFQAVAALLGIGVLGFWIIGRRRVPANALGLLSSIAIDVALPCLIIANILTQFSPQKFPDWWRMPLWWVGFTAIALALTLLTSLISKKATRGEFAMSLFFQNGIFFPLIIIVGIYGSTSSYLVLLFLFIFLQASMVFSTYPFFIRKKSEGSKLSWGRVVNPVLVMTVIGLILVFTGLRPYIPSFLIMILTLVGAMATPLFMLILGGNIYNDFMNKEAGGAKLEIGEVIKFVVIKNLVFPLVVLALLIWIRPDNFTAFLLVLQAAIPPITAIPIFTERQGGNRAITNQFIVASFFFSIISIPGMIFLFSRFFEMPVK